MRRREQDFVGAGTEERAGGLSQAGRDPFHIATAQIECVDLVKRVARFALALENEALAVGRPVAFSGAAAFDGQAPDAREKVTFLILRAAGLKRGHGQRQRRKNPGGRRSSHPFHPGTSDRARRV
jgi:hypothetical protein